MDYCIAWGLENAEEETSVDPVWFYVGDFSYSFYCFDHADRCTQALYGSSGWAGGNNPRICCRFACMAGMASQCLQADIQLNDQFLRP